MLSHLILRARLAVASLKIGFCIFRRLCRAQDCMGIQAGDSLTMFCKIDFVEAGTSNEAIEPKVAFGG